VKALTVFIISFEHHLKFQEIRVTEYVGLQQFFWTRLAAAQKAKLNMSQKARVEGAVPPSPQCIAIAKFIRYNKALKNRAGSINGKRVEYFKGHISSYC
jgi:hypothetical protein